MSKQKQMSEHILTGGVLAAVGGFFDAYTYICRGHVFANAQTGNIVLFGVMLSEGRKKMALSYLVPIIAFAVGILIANIIKVKFKNTHNKWIHWRQIVVAFEIALLFIVANIPIGRLNGVANVIISFVCSLQVESFRKVNGYAFATTMCTGNLRSGTEQLFAFVRTREFSKLRGMAHYYGIIAIFILGAVLGAIFTGLLEESAIYIAVIGLAIVLLLMFKREEEQYDRRKEN